MTEFSVKVQLHCKNSQLTTYNEYYTGCPKKNFPSEFSRWTIKNPFYVKFTFDRQVTIIKDFQGFFLRCPAEGSVKKKDFL